MSETVCVDGCGAYCTGDVCECPATCEGRRRVEREARARHSGVATSATTFGVCEGACSDRRPHTLWETTFGWWCWACCLREWPPPFVPYVKRGQTALDL